MKSWPNKLFVGVKKWILLWSRDEFTWKMSSPHFKIRQLFFRRKLRQLYWLILEIMKKFGPSPLPTSHTLMHSTKALLYFIIDKHKLLWDSVIWVYLLKPKRQDQWTWNMCHKFKCFKFHSPYNRFKRFSRYHAQDVEWFGQILEYHLF